MLPRDGFSRLAILAILLAALVACGLVWANTRWGVGLRSDSFAYVSGARNLADGLGYSRVSGGGEVKPITHFPPLFSGLLAVIEMTGGDAVVAARWLVIVLFGINTLLVGALGWRASGLPWVGFISAAAFGFNPLLVDIHSWAMSEPLFITLTLLTVLSLPRTVTSGRGWFAVVAGLLAGLSFLTRYVGAACILAGAATLALTLSGNRRLRLGAAFLVSAVLPVVAWIVRNVRVSGSTTNRTFFWHPVSAERLLQAGRTISAWLLPDNMPASQSWFPAFGLLVGIGALVLALMASLRPRAARDDQKSAAVLTRALGLFVIAYTGVLAGNLVLLDSSTPLDARILSPLLAVLTPLAASAAAGLVRTRGVAAKAGGAVIVLALLAGYLTDGYKLLYTGWHSGWGFSNRSWQSSAVMDAVRDLPPMILYTNEPDIMYFLTGRPSYIIFGEIDPVTGRPREGYEQWLSAARSTLLRGGSALVLVDVDALMADPADRVMVETLSEGLVTIGTYKDGVILSAGAAP